MKGRYRILSSLPMILKENHFRGSIFILLIQQRGTFDSEDDMQMAT